MQQVSSVHCRMRNVSRDTFRGLLRELGLFGGAATHSGERAVPRC